MYIIFGNVGYWQIPTLKILKYFKLNVYYLYIEAKSDIKKNEIATKLKKNNIFPIPIELEKKISPKNFSLFDMDYEEFAYNKNVKLVPDTILKKYCHLFSIDKKKIKKLRLLIQDFIFNKHSSISSVLSLWMALHPKKKIIYVSFKFTCFYITDINQNIFKIIIPIDIVNYFIKIIEKTFLSLPSFINKGKKEQENQVSNRHNLKEIEKKSVAFIVHKGLIYGDLTKQGDVLFEKSLYYSDDKNSCLNKYNILHLDYENFSSPDQNLHWICLKKIKVSSTKIFSMTLLACVKTCYLIRSWSAFLGWLLFIKQYSIYIKYCEVIKKFKNLKIAIIDYDILCPKTLILALEKSNIKTIATQERFIATFYTSFSNVIVDTYYVASEFVANFIKKSKFHDIENIIPVGQYRSDYISLYKKKIIPEEISKAKENGKKIIIALGYQTVNNWFESYTKPLLSWTAHINFLEDIVKLSRHLNDTFIILRPKSIEWITNTYFKSILNKINDCENIIISSNYKESFYSYKLCANADLIIAKHTSLADECLSHEIPVLFHDYTHNLKKSISVAFDYSPSGLMCYNFEELLERSKSLLFNSSSKLKNEIAALNKTIYHVKEKGNIKNKIIMHLEN